MSNTESDDLNDIAALWQQQVEGETRAVVNTEERKHRRLFVLDWSGALIMLISGIVFLTISQSAVFIVAACALFTGSALQLRQTYFNRNRMLNYDDWSTLGLLEYRLLVNETACKRFRYNQYGAVVIIVFTALLALMKYVVEILVPTELIVVYTIMLPFMIFLIWFNQRRIKQNHKKLIYLKQLITEFVQAEHS